MSFYTTRLRVLLHKEAEYAAAGLSTESVQGYEAEKLIERAHASVPTMEIRSKLCIINNYVYMYIYTYILYLNIYKINCKKLLCWRD